MEDLLFQFFLLGLFGVILIVGLYAVGSAKGVVSKYVVKWKWKNWQNTATKHLKDKKWKKRAESLQAYLNQFVQKSPSFIQRTGFISLLK